MGDTQISRGTVALAQALDDLDLTRQEAGKLAGWDPGHIGKVLRGRSPGGSAMGKATRFVPNMNLWRQEADAEELRKLDRLIASINARALRKRKAS